MLESTNRRNHQDRLERLSPGQWALLQQRLAGKGPPAARESSIPRRAGAGPCPVSSCQQRLWFLDQLSPGTSTYNVPYAMRLEGDPNIAALARALESVVERHEALRTVFACVAGTPVQVVLRKWAPVLRVVDLRERPGDDKVAEARRLLEDEARWPFNLARDPMLRSLLVQLSDRECHFLHVTHHIAWDYRSRVILYAELARGYEAFAAGRSMSRPDPPIQYADFAVWQRRRLRGERLERLTAYWQGQLAGVPARLELPTDRPRPPIQSQLGAKYFFDFPPRLVEAAKALSRQEGATIYMTLLAAFYVFLYRLTDQDDICVGSPIAGRDQVETEDLIGFFINTLVLRGRISGDLTFREWIKRVREVTLEAYAHQELPFEKLVEIARPPRDLSRNPLFQVNFRVAAAAPPTLELRGLTVAPLDLIDTATSKFDLAFELSTLPGARSYCEYSTDLFTESTAKRFSAGLLETIEAILSRPEVQLRAVSGPAFPVHEGHRPFPGGRLIGRRRTPVTDSSSNDVNSGRRV
jgi:Condensation domain